MKSIVVILILFTANMAFADTCNSNSASQNSIVLSEYWNLRGAPSSAELYCKDAMYIDLVKRNQQLIQSRVDIFKKFLLQTPEQYAWTSAVGNWLTYKEIADGLRVSQIVGHAEDGGFEVLTSFAFQTKQGYELSKVLDDLGSRAGLTHDSYQIRAVLQSGCAFSK